MNKIYTGDIAPPNICVSGVSKFYALNHQPISVLRKLTLSVSNGEIVAVVGPSGCGKSTLLRIISGLEKPDSGEVFTVEQDPLGSPTIGLLQQRPVLIPWRNIRDNMLVFLELVDRSDGARNKVDDILARSGLATYGDAYPHQLSGGYRQIAALCINLVLELPVLLLDEPLGAVDEILREEIAELVAKLARGPERAVMFVTHSIEEAVFVADRVVVLTPRPATVFATIRSPLQGNRTRTDRDLKSFHETCVTVRKALREARLTHEDGIAVLEAPNDAKRRAD